jgi:3-isopropylmalate dehydratase large subunit
MLKTLYDKLWDEHIVHYEEDGTAILYIDRHLVHEVSSPQAFEGLREVGRKLWRISSVIATVDHGTPTAGWERGYDAIEDAVCRTQVTTLDANIKEFGAAAFFPFLSKRQGIVHVIGPESGATLPGMTVVCGDSHTSTHGAFGALAHGIGTSEVEHVMATQTLLAKKAKNMLVKVEGKPRQGEGRQQAGRDRARAQVHGAGTEQADERHPDRQGVHRLVYQQPHRGHARSGGGSQAAWSKGGEEHQARDGRSGLRPREGTGRARRA